MSTDMGSRPMRMDPHHIPLEKDTGMIPGLDDVRFVGTASTKTEETRRAKAERKSSCFGVMAAVDR